MITTIHSINLPKIVQIGWGHHVDFCVWKNRPLLLAKGVRNCVFFEVSLAVMFSNFVTNHMTTSQKMTDKISQNFTALQSFQSSHPGSGCTGDTYKYHAYVYPVFKQLNLLKLSDLYPITLLWIYFKLKQEILRYYTLNMLPKRYEERLQHQTEDHFSN